MVQAAGQEHYTGADAARFMEQQGGMFGGEVVGVSAKLTFAPGTAKTTEVYANPEVAGRLGVEAKAKTVSSPAQEATRAAQVASSSSVREAIAASRASVRGVGAAQPAPKATPAVAGAEKKSNGIG